jgi:itaconyl-CoA hydratase
MSGFSRYFEDFNIGDVFQHRIGRTISEADNTWFTLLTLNTNQVHFNAQYGAATPFGRLLVNSGFTIGLVLGMTVTDISENAVANLGMDNIRFPHPIFVGDTVWAESIITGKRESKSRPNAGVISVKTRGLNQDGEVCLTFERSALIYKRGSAPLMFPQTAEPMSLE